MPECPYVDHGMTIRTDGSVEPCCAFRNIDTTPVFYNDERAWKEKFANIKEELKTGWPSGCVECQHGEESGKSSMRSRAVEYKEFQFSQGIEYWDFKLNITCNLACKMCGAHSSSTWRREVLKHEELYDTFYRKGVSKSKAWIEDDGLDMEHFYPYLLDAKTVKFTGGEPFLIPQVKECVKFLVESEASHAIKLHFITNGTQDITEWLPLFKHFKIVWLTISVDAVGDLYEYIRQGASWEQVSNNLIKIRQNMLPNMKLVITPLPMSLNYGRIHEITEWCDKHNIEWNESIDCIHPAIMSPKAVHDAQLKKELIAHLEKLDRIYNTDYKIVCPHLVDNNE